MARKARGTYLPLDIEFFDNARVLEAGERAGWLYLAMCCRAKRLLSDGVLSEHQVDRLHIPGWRKRLETLIETGLVVRTDDGRFLILGWLERNLSASQVEQVRAADRARKGSDSNRNPSGIRADPREVEVEDRGEGEVQAVPGTEGSRPLRVIS